MADIDDDVYRDWIEFCSRFGWHFGGLHSYKAHIRLKSGNAVLMTEEMREDIEDAIRDAASEAASDAIRDYDERL